MTLLTIFAVLAIICGAASIALPNYHLVAVGVIFLGIALLLR